MSRARAEEYLYSLDIWLDDSAPEERYARADKIVEVMESFANLLLKELTHEECIHCRRGDPPRFLPRPEKYAHRLPEGRNGTLIWVPCRATAIWKVLNGQQSKTAGRAALRKGR